MSLLRSPKTYLVAVLISIGLAVAAFVSAGRIFSDNRPTTESAADRYVTIEGSKIRYRDVGVDLPPLVFLHGFGGSLHRWEAIQDHLGHRRMIALDLVGFGASDAPAIRYDLESHRSYLIAFLDALGLDRVVLVGSSMGASLAAWTAAKSKERVAGVVLFAPSAYPGSMGYKNTAYRWFYRPGAPNRVARLVVANPLYRWLHPRTNAPQALDVTNSYTDSFAEALTHLDQPGVLVWSPGDRVALYAAHAHYLERAPQLDFVSVEEALGHNIIGGDPAGSATIIKDFLARYSLE